MHTKDPFCIHPSIRPLSTVLCTLDGAANVAPHGKYWARPVLEADSTRLFGKVETSIGRSTRLRRRSAATLRHRVADLPRRWGGEVEGRGRWGGWGSRAFHLRRSSVRTPPRPKCRGVILLRTLRGRRTSTGGRSGCWCMPSSAHAQVKSTGRCER